MLRGRTTGRSGAVTIGSLFSGGGGWEAGAVRLGMTPVFGVELTPWIAQAHARAFGGHVVNQDAAKVDYAAHGRRVGPLDVLVSSPPCQPTSKVGKAWATRRARMGLEVETEAGEVCDPNVGRYTVNAVEAFAPSVVLLENNAAYVESAAFRHVVHELRLRGYFLDWAVLRAEDYGVPSGRERLILRASKSPLPPWPSKRPRVSWWTAIADLVPSMPRVELADWQAKFMREYPPPAGVPLLIAGGNPTRTGGRTNVWKTPDQPAWATQTRQNTSGMRLVEPDGTVRQVSVRALARLQGFPDDYPLDEVAGERSLPRASSGRLTRSQAIHLLGNSVPPLLATQLLEPFVGSGVKGRDT